MTFISLLMDSLLVKLICCHGDGVVILLRTEDLDQKQQHDQKTPSCSVTYQM